MISRVAFFALLTFVLAQIGATPAAGDTELKPPIYYLGRADPRLCPSPMCGGIWLKAVNGASSNCAEPAGRECYVTGLEFEKGAPDDQRRQRLTELVTRGGGLVQGHLTNARIDGFPELKALRVVRVWRPTSSRRPRGTFRSLLDNGVRCITHPCFSIQAVALNQERVANVSEVDVSATGASASERRWARTRMATRHLIAAGKVVRKPNAGPAGTGRVFLASQIYFPARPH